MQNISYFYGDNYCLIHEENCFLYYKYTFQYFTCDIKTKEVIEIRDKFRFEKGNKRKYDRGDLCNDGSFKKNPNGSYWVKQEYFIFSSIIQERKWWFILKYGIIGYNDGVWVEKGIVPYFKNKLRQLKSSFTYQ